jgi:hypothetical protein
MLVELGHSPGSECLFGQGVVSPNDGKKIERQIERQRPHNGSGIMALLINA